MGRKRKKPADKRSAYIRVMVTPGEFKEIEREAKAVGADVSAWVRSKILELIRKGKDK